QDLPTPELPWMTEVRETSGMGPPEGGAKVGGVHDDAGDGAGGEEVPARDQPEGDPEDHVHDPHGPAGGPVPGIEPAGENRLCDPGRLDHGGRRQHVHAGTGRSMTTSKTEGSYQTG